MAKTLTLTLSPGDPIAWQHLDPDWGNPGRWSKTHFARNCEETLCGTKFPEAIGYSDNGQGMCRICVEKERGLVYA